MNTRDYVKVQNFKCCFTRLKIVASLPLADGWILERISLLANPNLKRPKRFWGVYTKLKIFNMTNYKKVVYLDADTIVLRSIEDLFKCGKFCANLKHSERMNSGVMVVEPSEELFKDMVGKVNTLPSYTGGDQGFLNSYYAGFANAHVFEPNLSLEVRNSRLTPEMERLSTLYNADVGLYMLANKWMVDEKELRIIHYTLGPLKPWDWWTAWLLKPVDLWQDVRVGLKESLPGTGGGNNANDELLVKFLFFIPLLALVACYYRPFFELQKDLFGALCRGSLCNYIRHLYYKCRSGAPYSAIGVSSNSNQQFTNGTNAKLPPYLGGISVLVCFGAAIASLVAAFAIIPRQVMPWTGLSLLYEWTFALFIIIFGSYLHIIYECGRSSSNQGTFSSGTESPSRYNSGKGHQRQASCCDAVTWYYGLGMGFLAIAAPSLPCLFGITALFSRLGLMVGGGMVLVAFMTYASENLVIRAYMRGRGSGLTPD
ncbi:hypothetical protein AMTR_s01134p00004530 [Amborella trichopoda]|uniref:Hexosyltransferase n=1 Tax=Amborella trichopoda TaxID=13333 RepID=W1NRN0_AMBTC|nr:hypothetical protein AMTR_s01134p00004530 [Amborella trichopoda]